MSIATATSWSACFTISRIGIHSQKFRQKYTERVHAKGTTSFDDVSARDYRHAQDVWTRRKMTTFKEYHDFYMMTDVLLLADYYEAFRQAMLRAHGMDCLHFPSLSSLSFQMALPN